jgi:L-rhamnose isomerase/sugar isomerase
MLTAVKIPAGFHFNNMYAADDDQSVEPNSEMARIFYELVNGNVIFNVDNSKNWAFMIDQCSARENRIHAILHSIDSLQLSLAKSILVDTETIIRYQKQDELILANRVFNDALINADVRPIVYKARSDKGLQPDILQAYIDSGYQQKIEKKRK